MGLLPSIVALADVLNERAPGMVGIMLERMPAMMAIVQERLPGMMTMLEGRLFGMMQEIQGIFIGTDESGRSFGRQRNFWGQEDRFLQLLAAIQGRIPDTLVALEEWKNDTEITIVGSIPYMIYSLNENITRVQEAIEQKLPGLMQII